MKIKKGLEVSTGDFWYDLTDEGYLKPYEICEDEVDAARMEDAIAVIQDFQRSCEEQIENFIQ